MQLLSQYYILRGNVPFPRAGHIWSHFAGVFNVSNKVLVTLYLLLTMREHICRVEQS